MVIDKRIEAALEAAWSHTTQSAGGMSFAQHEDKSPEAAGEFQKAIVAAPPYQHQGRALVCHGNRPGRSACRAGLRDRRS